MNLWRRLLAWVASQPLRQRAFQFHAVTPVTACRCGHLLAWPIARWAGTVRVCPSCQRPHCVSVIKMRGDVVTRFKVVEVEHGRDFNQAAGAVSGGKETKAVQTLQA